MLRAACGQGNNGDWWGSPSQGHISGARADNLTDEPWGEGQAWWEVDGGQLGESGCFLGAAKSVPLSRMG